NRLHKIPRQRLDKCPLNRKKPFCCFVFFNRLHRKARTSMQAPLAIMARGVGRFARPFHQKYLQRSDEMTTYSASTTTPSRRRHLAGAVILAFSTLFGAGAVQAQETIKLGFLGPLSGGNAQQGLGAQNGFLLAIDQWNQTEGAPFKVEGVVLDDASD